MCERTNRESEEPCTNFSLTETPRCKQNNPAAVMYKVAVGYKLLMKGIEEKQQETGPADVSSEGQNRGLEQAG